MLTKLNVIYHILFLILRLLRHHDRFPNVRVMDEDVFLQYTTGVDARQTAVEWELAWSGMSEGYCTLGLCGLYNSMMRLTLTWGCVGKWGVCGPRQHAHASLWFRWTPNHPMRTKAALEYWPLISVYATTNQRDITTGKRRARRVPTMQVECCHCCYCSKFVRCVGYFSARVLFVSCGSCWFCFYFCLVATEKMYGNVVTNVDVLADYDKHDT